MTGPGLTVPDGVLPETSYERVLRACFGTTYAEGTDVWTDEAAMRGRPAALLADSVPPDGRVLDLGTGRAVDATLLADRGLTVVGLDLCRPPGWAPPADAARSRPMLVQGPLSCLVDRPTFDGILDNGCFHHQHPDHLADYLDGVRRRLRPGGVFVVSTFARSATQPPLLATRRGRVNQAFDPTTLRALLGAAGLVIDHLEDVPRADGRRYLLARGQLVPTR